LKFFNLQQVKQYQGIKGAFQKITAFFRSERSITEYSPYRKKAMEAHVISSFIHLFRGEINTLNSWTKPKRPMLRYTQ